MPVANRGALGETPFYRYLAATSLPCEPPALRGHAPVFAHVVRCRQSKRGPVDVALVGDSHAEHLFAGLAAALPNENVAYYIVDAAPLPTQPDFARIVRHVSSTPSIRTVVVSAFWDAHGVHAAQLRSTLDALDAKRVFVSDDVPFFPFDPSACKYRQALLQPSDCGTDTRSFEARYAGYGPALRAVVARVPRARLLPTARYLCGSLRCEMARGGRLLYRDDNHLNVGGSDFVARAILAHDRAFATSVYASSAASRSRLAAGHSAARS